MGRNDRYNENYLDKQYPSADESVLGHMICEAELDPIDAVCRLRPWVASFKRSTESAIAGDKVVAIAAIAATFGLTAIAGASLFAIAPALAGVFAWTQRQKSQRELDSREAEFEMIRTCPEMLDAMVQMLDRGLDPGQLVSVYDRILDGFRGEYQLEGAPELTKADLMYTLQLGVQDLTTAKSLTSEILSELDSGKALPAGESKSKAIAESKAIANSVEPQPESEARSGEVEFPPLNPIDLLGSKIDSTLLIAGTGAGKGVLMSLLLRNLKKNHPNLRVVHFEGKKDPKEAGYWEGVMESSWGVDLEHCSGVEAAQTIKKVMAAYDKGHVQNQPSLLVIDEVNALVDRLTLGGRFGSKEDKDHCNEVLGALFAKIKSLATGGMSHKRFVWLIGQSPNLSDLGLSGGSAAQLRKISIGNDRTSTVLDKICNTEFTGAPRDKVYRAKLNELMEISPVGRVFFDSATSRTHGFNGWHPLDKLEILCGYDRDTDTFLSEGAISNQVQAPTADEAVYEEVVLSDRYQSEIDQMFRLGIATNSIIGQAFNISEKDAGELLVKWARQNQAIARFDSNLGKLVKVHG